MKLLKFIAFMIVCSPTFSMTTSVEKMEKNTSFQIENTQHSDRKKRINKKRKRKCSKWGKRSFAG